MGMKELLKRGNKAVNEWKKTDDNPELGMDLPPPPTYLMGRLAIDLCVCVSITHIRQRWLL